MLENLKLIQNLPWEMAVLGGFCILNLVFIFFYRNKLQAMQRSQLDANKHLLELAEDIKALYESGATLGGKVKGLEYGAKIMKQEQEQLSLKEPSQQMYRNAVQQINNGESINQISESSGLSRGEVELLKLFQKIDTETKNSSIESTVS